MHLYYKVVYTKDPINWSSLTRKIKNILREICFPCLLSITHAPVVAVAHRKYTQQKNTNWNMINFEISFYRVLIYLPMFVIKIDSLTRPHCVICVEKINGSYWNLLCTEQSIREWLYPQEYQSCFSSGAIKNLLLSVRPFFNIRRPTIFLSRISNDQILNDSHCRLLRQFQDILLYILLYTSAIFVLLAQQKKLFRVSINFNWWAAYDLCIESLSSRPIFFLIWRFLPGWFVYSV